MFETCNLLKSIERHIYITVFKLIPVKPKRKTVLCLWHRPPSKTPPTLELFEDMMYSIHLFLKVCIIVRDLDLPLMSIIYSFNRTKTALLCLPLQVFAL